MRTFAVAATVAAPADAAWDALATPSRWSEWGPSVRAVDCADETVRAGTTGRVRTTPGPSLRFVVTAVEPGRSWHWRVAGVAATGHRVDPVDATNTRITFEVPCWAAPYAVVCRRALRRLAAVLEPPNE
ncbi:MAG: hypothetical protein FJW95_15830 [Actinobacteria bacterium]|nr:hypothetical protein [Actinomycetota bacterium]